MEYISTRGNGEHISAAEAIIKGIADDGGLFVPTDIPQVDKKFIEELAELSYCERANRILSLFLTDFSHDEIAGCVKRAYQSNNFDDEQIAPLKIFSDISVSELWHGPTSAFKDMALQLLPQLMSTSLKKLGETDEVLILVATSGDTGKAALEGFKNVPQIKIMVFYPDNGVSKIQRLQMVTQAGENVSVVAVKGNFDDAQTGVKNIFGDEAFNHKLNASGTKLSSANSINWGRLVPQIVYYFSAYADLLKTKKITSGDTINFTVPTGNFGNILAGFYAKLMGLPVGRLVCASNKNNVLTDFLETGKYNREREFFKTITPSMDILISSNLERLLYHLSKDANAVADWMKSLREDGHYDVGETMLKKIQETFWADWADDDKTSATIKKVYEDRKYILDPHTAVAWTVAEEYREKSGDKREMVIVSTASPYKFNDSVLKALNVTFADSDPFAMLEKLEELNEVAAPAGLSGLKNAKEIHSQVCGKDEMMSVVMSFAEKS